MKKLVRRHTRQTRSQLQVNLWGAAGYMASIMSYLLLATAVFRYLISSSVIVRQTVAPASSGTSSDASSSLSLVDTLFAYGVTIVIVVLAAVLLVIFPYLLSRYYARAVRRIVRLYDAAVSLRNLFYTKAICAVLPLLGFMVLTFLDPYFDKVFVFSYIASVGFALLSEALFYVQLRVLRRHPIKDPLVW